MSMLMPVERCLIFRPPFILVLEWQKRNGLNHMVVGAKGYIHNKETKEYVGKNRHLDSGAIGGHVFWWYNVFLQLNLKKINIDSISF